MNFNLNSLLFLVDFCPFSFMSVFLVHIEPRLLFLGFLHWQAPSTLTAFFILKGLTGSFLVSVALTSSGSWTPSEPELNNKLAHHSQLCFSFSLPVFWESFCLPPPLPAVTAGVGVSMRARGA